MAIAMPPILAVPPTFVPLLLVVVPKVDVRA